ncbi:MAG: hypothetical protein LBH76_06595, partial [Propionibacteriaceae bacterium]|nr:hypothetical protein [Propionibacteriaceae bacterium]
MAVALVAAVSGIMIGSSVPAQADSGPCGLYGSGWAVNSYCGDVLIGSVRVAATKAFEFYSAGRGGISVRYGSYVEKGMTSYISSQAT